MNGRLGTALIVAAVVAVTAALSGCVTSTALNAQWVNPQAGNRLPVKSVMVMGSTARPRAESRGCDGRATAPGIKAVIVQSVRVTDRRTAGDSSAVASAVRCCADFTQRSVTMSAGSPG